MIRLCLSLFLGLAIVGPGTGAGAAEDTAPPISVRVYDTVLNQVSHRIFGQFLERASFGEPGPEAALLPGTNRIQPAAVERMKAMRIPVIRFPGGRDVDFLDWRDLIDNVPDRAGGRPISYGADGDPITNRFGLDEYFALREDLGNETILVVNLLDAVSRKLPLREAARRAAALVAYTNASLGQELPEGMRDWPAVRDLNGHPEPFRAEYVQLGNESWQWPRKRLVDADGQPLDAESAAAWLRECLLAYIEAIRAVDPGIEIIIDGRMPFGVEREVLADPAIREHVALVALHAYAPGPMVRVQSSGAPVPSEALSPADWWRAWTAMPGAFGPAGQNRGISESAGFLSGLGYRIAVTEWNWNGWAPEGAEIPAPLGWRDWRLASGIGAAGFLHGLMRSEAALATQSMLLGAHWSIAAVRVDPTGIEAPYASPQAQVTNLYRHHHGRQSLRIETSDIETYDQTLSMGWMGATAEKVAFVDIMATRSSRKLFIHSVNRDAERAYPLSIDLSAFTTSGTATRHIWTARPGFSSAAESDLADTTSTDIFVRDGRLETTLPAKSVSIVAIDLANED